MLERVIKGGFVHSFFFRPDRRVGGPPPLRQSVRPPALNRRPTPRLRLHFRAAKYARLRLTRSRATAQTRFADRIFVAPSDSPHPLAKICIPRVEQCRRVTRKCIGANPRGENSRLTRSHVLPPPPPRPRATPFASLAPLGTPLCLCGWETLSILRVSGVGKLSFSES
jgi:hypothetical protein